MWRRTTLLMGLLVVVMAVALAIRGESAGTSFVAALIFVPLIYGIFVLVHSVRARAAGDLNWRDAGHSIDVDLPVGESVARERVHAALADAGAADAPDGGITAVYPRSQWAGRIRVAAAFEPSERGTLVRLRCSLLDAPLDFGRSTRLCRKIADRLLAG